MPISISYVLPVTFIPLIHRSTRSRTSWLPIHRDFRYSDSRVVPYVQALLQALSANIVSLLPLRTYFSFYHASTALFSASMSLRHSVYLLFFDLIIAQCPRHITLFHSCNSFFLSVLNLASISACSIQDEPSQLAVYDLLIFKGI